MDRYEISIWEDYLVAASEETPAHYGEQKIAIIGSDTMTGRGRAIEPKLVENINGTNTFTFKVFYNYTNTETGEKESNPFINLLVNERKIKVLWKNKWYSLVIKNIQEASDKKSITYTCKDLFINELSKTGFNLEFDTELENNQGTIAELGEKILDGSDWQLGESDVIKQKIEESVYEVTGTEILAPFAAKSLAGETVSITDEDKILVFYSVVQNKAEYLQFLYEADSNFVTDSESMMVTNGEILSADVVWEETTTHRIAKIGDTPIIKTTLNKNLSTKYRAERLVRSQKTKFVNSVNRYVGLYTYNNKTIYGFKETVYKDATIVNNLLVNYENFAGTEGWSGGEMIFSLYPKFTNVSDPASYNAKSYLRLTSGTYHNSGLDKTVSYLENGYQKGEQYIVRYKAKGGTSEEPTAAYITSGLTPQIGTYSISENGAYTPVTSYFNFGTPEVKEDWVEVVATVGTSITREEIREEDFGFLFVSDGIYWLEKVEMFPLVYGENLQGEEARINPGDMDIQSIAETQYKYYEPSDEEVEKEKIHYLYVGNTEWSAAEPIYNEDFVKIRSITGKNSNRFNLLQSLAETFECWVKFDIAHDTETGKMWLIDGKPQKTVTFHEKAGDEIGYGFIYGHDLKSIQRTVASDQIVSKVIVAPNVNEHAADGFCTIARSVENYNRDNFILNFDHYITHGLLNDGEVNRDLYHSDAIGYYYWLNKYNTEYDENTKILVAKKLEKTKQDSLLTVYDQYVTSLLEEITSVESQIKQLASVDTMDEAVAYIAANPDNTKVVVLVQNWRNLKNSLAQYQTQKTSLESSLSYLSEFISTKEERQKELIELKGEKELQFYEKYSRFIQEGSWTSQEYLDDNLYYLDAVAVAATSSKPKVSYNISVIRLCALEEYKNKIFKVGDISFVQDVDFFGYTWVNEVKTPYKEKVIITELTSHFETPNQDTFKVQNYKTSFEDLFQRITASTQALQYASGEYQKAANAFTATGEIDALTMQNSLNVNQNLVISAQNDSVIYDSTGITVADTANPNKKIKLTSGGLFLSQDGGVTWGSGIRGDGINTGYLTAGSILTNKITLMDGNFTTFRWDSDGLNAYDRNDYGTIFNRFVRFDRFGIYGIDQYTGDENAQTYSPSSIEEIFDDAKFGLTWDGFFMKNKYGNGYVTISSSDDLLVSDGTNDRIKIGNIGTAAAPVYGIKINNADGNPILETNDVGSLWLKEKLNIETETGNSVAIGELGTLKPMSTSIHEVFNANDDFIIYEDGSVTGTNVNFTGGQIGGVSIQELVDNAGASSISISPRDKLSFKVDADGVATPSSYTLSIISSNMEISPANIEWNTSTDLTEWTLRSTDETYALSYTAFDNLDASGLLYIRATYTDNEKDYYAFCTVDKLSAGASTFRVRTSQPEVLRYKDWDEASESFVDTFSADKITFELREELGNAGMYYETTGTSNVLTNIPEGCSGLLVIAPAGADETEEGFVITHTNAETSPTTTLLYEVAYGNSYDIDLFAGYNKLTADVSFKCSYITPSGDLFSTNSYYPTFSISRPDLGDGGWKIIEGLTNTYLYEDAASTFYTLDLDEILNTNSTNESLLDFRDSLVTGDLILRAQMFKTEEDTLYSSLLIPVRSALKDELARLDILASGIVASVQNSRLHFNSSGLSIENGGFSISDAENEKVFYTDISGNLTLKGIVNADSGYFKGELAGATGSFSGSIIATSGNIGGLTLADGILSSVNNQLSINGTTGQIITNNILIKEGAAIDTYLSLGNAKLWNPIKSSSGKDFITIDDAEGNQVFVLQDDGNLKAGSIKIDSEHSTMKIGGLLFDGEASSIEGHNWKVEPTKASFNRIVLGESIIAPSKTQSVGGQMLFKPASPIESYTSTGFVLEEALGVAANAWLHLTDSTGTKSPKNIQVESVNGKELSFVESADYQGYDTATLLSNVSDSILTDSLVFGINSTNQDTLFAKKRAISFQEMKIEDSNLIMPDLPNLLIGDLSSINNNYGYGLYADNVYLKGSLTTELSDGMFAGINTQGLINATKFGGTDASKIVFWAGATSDSSPHVQEAAFQVTEKGSLYASQGVFEGSIITKSVVECAKLYTPEIWGGSVESGASLSIYNTLNGIVFRKIEDETVSNTLGISDTAFTLKDKPFLLLGNRLQMLIEDIEVDTAKIGDLSIAEEEINNTDKTLSLSFSSANKQIAHSINGQKVTTISDGGLGVVGGFGVSGDVSYNNKMEYKNVVGGYDLYVAG